MDSDVSSMQFVTRDGFDLAGWLNAVARQERKRAQQVLAPLRPLPPRPKLSWYESQAKQLLRQLREVQPDARLTCIKDQLARDLGLPSWRKLAEAVRERRLRSERFGAALRARDDREVLSALVTDPSAVVDFALTAGEPDLSYLGNVGHYGSKAALDTLHLVLFALAKYGKSPDLPWQLSAIVVPDFDWQAAMTVLRDRQREAESNPRPAVAADVLDEAISSLAVYDEPDYGDKLSDD